MISTMSPTATTTSLNPLPLPNNPTRNHRSHTLKGAVQKRYNAFSNAYYSRFGINNSYESVDDDKMSYVHVAWGTGCTLVPATVFWGFFGGGI